MGGALTEFNALPADRAVEELLSCCAAPGWADEVAGGRPYSSVDELVTAAGDALATLGWDEIALALAAHPRIGQRPSGTGREAAWSRREQSGTDSSTQGTLDALADANRAYEERFGWVFLIFASGRSDTEMLAAARERRDNDEATERAVVRGELGRIVALRLRKLLT
jgi:2-oxo-4-hydroxy-4-carboxy-5-ureidoimidazoline decarboxylase